jgi:hypothetical protein
VAWNENPANPKYQFGEAFSRFLRAKDWRERSDAAEDMVTVSWYALGEGEREKFGDLPDFDSFADFREYNQAVKRFVRALTEVAHVHGVYGYPDHGVGENDSLTGQEAPTEVEVQA